MLEHGQSMLFPFFFNSFWMSFSLFSQDEEKNKKNKVLNQNKIFKKSKDYD